MQFMFVECTNEFLMEWVYLRLVFSFSKYKEDELSAIKFAPQLSFPFRGQDRVFHLDKSISSPPRLLRHCLLFSIPASDSFSLSFPSSGLLPQSPGENI